MSLHEVVELFMNLIVAPYEVVQMVLSVMPIFIEATSDNLSEHEIMGGGDETRRSYSSPGFRVSVHPEAGSQGANALWLGQPHHPEVTAAPPHSREASQWRRVSPPCLGGEREVSAQSAVSLIGNGGVSGAWPIGIRPQHLFQLVQPKSGHLPLHLSPSEQVYQSGRDQRQEPPA